MDDIAHWNVNATNGNKYGSVVVYECDEGYQIDGGVPRTYCQGKNWKHGDTKPTCTSKSTDRGILENMKTPSLLALVSLLTGEHLET